MWKMRRFSNISPANMPDPPQIMEKLIHNPWLRYIFENLFLPEVPVWFNLHALGLLR